MIKKISGDAGHNCSPDSGAVGYKVEDKLTKEVLAVISSELKKLNVEFVDCTPYNARYSLVRESLSYRVNKANKSNSDLHLCIHFNAGGGYGTESWVVSEGGKAEGYAIKITNEISKLGYKNRGVKTGNLYVIKNTTMPAVLVECSFVDSKEDMNRYNAKDLGKAIVKAVVGKLAADSTVKALSEIEEENVIKVKIVEEKLSENIEVNGELGNKEEIDETVDLINNEINKAVEIKEEEFEINENSNVEAKDNEESFKDEEDKEPLSEEKIEKKESKVDEEKEIQEKDELEVNINNKEENFIENDLNKEEKEEGEELQEENNLEEKALIKEEINIEEEKEEKNLKGNEEIESEKVVELEDEEEKELASKTLESAIEEVKIKANAKVINNPLKIKEALGEVVEGNIEVGTEIEVVSVFYGSQLVLIKYLKDNNLFTVYVENDSESIAYNYDNQWKNNLIKKVVYEDSYCTKEIGKIMSRRTATPLYEKNNAIAIVYDTDKGKNTKSGYVKYTGKFQFK